MAANSPDDINTLSFGSSDPTELASLPSISAEETPQKTHSNPEHRYGEQIWFKGFDQPQMFASPPPTSRSSVIIQTSERPTEKPQPKSGGTKAKKASAPRKRVVKPKGAPLDMSLAAVATMPTATYSLTSVPTAAYTVTSMPTATYLEVPGSVSMSNEVLTNFMANQPVSRAGGLPVLNVSSTNQLGTSFLTYGTIPVSVKNETNVQRVPEFVKYSSVAVTENSQSGPVSISVENESVPSVGTLADFVAYNPVKVTENSHSKAIPDTVQKDSQSGIQLLGFTDCLEFPISQQVHFQRNQGRLLTGNKKSIPANLPSTSSKLPAKPKSGRRKQKWTELREPYPQDHGGPMFGYQSSDRGSYSRKQSISKEPDKPWSVGVNPGGSTVDGEVSNDAGSSMGSWPQGKTSYSVTMPGAPTLLVTQPTSETLIVPKPPKRRKLGTGGRGGRKGGCSPKSKKSPVSVPKKSPKVKPMPPATPNSESTRKTTEKQKGKEQPQPIKVTADEPSAIPDLPDPKEVNVPNPEVPNPEVEKLRSLIAGRYDRRKHLLVEDKDIREKCKYNEHYVCTNRVATPDSPHCLGHTKLLNAGKKGCKIKKVPECAFAWKTDDAKNKCKFPASPESISGKYCTSHDLELKRVRQIIRSNLPGNDHISVFKNLCVVENPKKSPSPKNATVERAEKESCLKGHMNVSGNSPSKGGSNVAAKNKLNGDQKDAYDPKRSESLNTKQDEVRYPKAGDGTTVGQNCGTNKPAAERDMPKEKPVQSELSASSNKAVLITKEKLLDPDRAFFVRDLLTVDEELEDYKDPSLRDMEVYQQFQADSDDNSDDEEVKTHKIISTAGYHTTDELSLMLQHKLEDLNKLYKYNRKLDKELFKVRMKIYLEQSEEDDKLRKEKKKLCSNPDMLPSNTEDFSTAFVINQFIERENIRHLLKLGNTKGPLGLLIRKTMDAKKLRKEKPETSPLKYHRVAPANNRCEGKPRFTPDGKCPRDEPVAGCSKNITGKISLTEDEPVAGCSKYMYENQATTRPALGSDISISRVAGKKSPSKTQSDINSRITKKLSPSKKEIIAESKLKSTKRATNKSDSGSPKKGSSLKKSSNNKECSPEICSPISRGRRAAAKKERVVEYTEQSADEETVSDEEPFPPTSGKKAASKNENISAKKSSQEKKLSKNEDSLKNSSEEGDPPKKIWPKTCTMTDCSGSALPLTKYCFAHISYDTSQFLFSPCGNLKTTNTPCNTPLLSLDKKGCAIHAEDWLPDLPLCREEKRYIRREERSQMLLPDAENEVVDNILVDNFFDMVHLEEELAGVLNADYLDTSSESEESADEEKILPPLKSLENQGLSEEDSDSDDLWLSDNSETEDDEDTVDLADE